MEKNPFIFYEPVRGDDFYNREENITKIEKITYKERQQGNVWLVGARQVGKTSLLHRIYSLHQDERPSIILYGADKEFKVQFIYFNCQMLRDDNGFYQQMTQTFVNHFDFKIKEKRKSYDNFIKWLIRIYERDYYIIFLLDEFDAFIEKFIRKSPDDAAHFLDTLNVIKQDIPGLKDRSRAFGFVCASNSTFADLTRNIELSGSGFTNFQEEELSNFTEKQLSELANLYLENSAIRFSDEEIKFCYKMTKGYPFFAQNLYSIIFDEKIKNQGDLPKGFLSHTAKKEFKKAFKKTLNDWKDQNRLTPRTIEKIQDTARELALEVTSRTITDILKSS